MTYTFERHLTPRVRRYPKIEICRARDNACYLPLLKDAPVLIPDRAASAPDSNSGERERAVKPFANRA